MTFESGGESAAARCGSECLASECLSWRASAASWVAMSVGAWTVIWMLAQALVTAGP